MVDRNHSSSKLESHNHIKEVENRLQISLEERFNRLEILMTQRKYQDETVVNSPPAPKETMGREPSTGAQVQQGSQMIGPDVTLRATGVTPGATGMTPSQQSQSAGALWQPDKSEGMNLRPEWHSQHIY